MRRIKIYAAVLAAAAVLASGCGSSGQAVAESPEESGIESSVQPESGGSVESEEPLASDSGDTQEQVIIEESQVPLYTRPQAVSYTHLDVYKRQVFDKTGTLTKARPVVADVVTFGGRDKWEMLRIAACLEEHFPHSIANAVVQEAVARGLTHEEMHSKVCLLYTSRCV